MNLNYILQLEQIDRSMISLVGGKAANLGDMARMPDFLVPPGFCLTTRAYAELVEGNAKIARLLEDFTAAPEAEICRQIRNTILGLEIPTGLQKEIEAGLRRFPADQPLAVRSSATAEDRVEASCAGQLDSQLNVVGRAGVLEQVLRCWASLFSERAVSYRQLMDQDQGRARMAVLVQSMVPAEVSGVLFTADPLSGDRKLVCVEATGGLGDGLVGGRLNAERFTVRGGLVESRTATILTDEQVLRLADIGRRLEAHFGRPQDLEWALADGEFQLLQARPITTLFPLPETGDGAFHVYVSVGHQQMMTDAMNPLGLSVWLASAGRPMVTAGGRLFIDVAAELASPAGRNVLINVLGRSDLLVRDALLTILERGGIELPDQGSAPNPPDYSAIVDYDPALVPRLLENSRAALHSLRAQLPAHSGAELVDFILQDIAASRQQRAADKEGFAVIVTAMNAAQWLNQHLQSWLDEPNAADILSQSLPGNVTSQMGLELLEVADLLRPFPELLEFLQTTRDQRFLEVVSRYPGGAEFRQAFLSYLDKYGMRCAGEIDITRPRWSEEPLTLVPGLLNHVRLFTAGEGKRRFEQGLRLARQRERDILERLRAQPDGENKAAQTAAMIERLRGYAGYREYPKYALICRYFLYKEALLREARSQVERGRLVTVEDIFFLSLEELRQVLEGGQLDRNIVEERARAFRDYSRLSPPRVMTSDGEILNGRYSGQDLPEGALAGLAVSAGVVEGRARVLFSLAQACLEEGDILVTAYTDPSWTPLFVSIRALVTEVGGLMTHGAVIAREYGLPAVVGLDRATSKIKDGQRIRVNGSQGYVQILSD
ncbi:MAG: phosphoenolpyruvate synthase [Vulcanimicrobiota bacterium]